MSAASVTRTWAHSVRDGVAAFLAIAGVVAVIVGVLYLTAGHSLPHLFLGASHHGHHIRRASACLAGGALCIAAAWLIRVRKRALAAAEVPASAAGLGSPHVFHRAAGALAAHRARHLHDRPGQRGHHVHAPVYQGS
jgi:hypothetical protein